jgi:amylosucrase
MDWTAAGDAAKAQSPHGHIYRGTRHILARRKSIAAFSATHPTRIIDLNHRHIFAFARHGDGETVVCVFNFTEHEQMVAAERLRAEGVVRFHDLLAGDDIQADAGQLRLPPYGRVWLV